MIKQHDQYYIYAKKSLWIVFFAITLSVLVKAFFIGFYKVPTGSMMNTLLPGDAIIVNKVAYGARVNFYSFLPLAPSDQKNGIRMPGLSEIKREDVVVFNSPQSSGSILVKRCVALPGDTLIIKMSELRVNGKPLEHAEPIFDYTVNAKDTLTVNRVIREMGLSNSGYIYDQKKMSYLLTISEEQALSLKKCPAVTRVGKIIFKGGKNIDLYPASARKYWSRDNYGPLLIPGKNTVLKLDSTMLACYGYLIASEGRRITMKGPTVLIDGIAKKTYRFRRNYYFMMGDNRDHSADSRWIGFIPEQAIIGKVFFSFRM